jgi:hypothetical protein
VVGRLQNLRKAFQVILKNLETAWIQSLKIGLALDQME